MPLRQTFSVSTIAELASFNNTHCEVIFVNDRERTSGNPFRWAGNTVKPNGGTIHAGAGGAWEMMFEGAVNVNWFGALANGSDVTDQFQKAVDFAFAVARPVYVPGNPIQNIYHLNQINLYDTSIVYGDFRRSIILPASANVTTLFNIRGKNFNELKTFVHLKNLTIVNQLQAGPVSTGCTAINAEFIEELHLSELIVDGFDVNLNIANSSIVYGNRLRLRGGSRNNARITWNKQGIPLVGGWVFMTECEFIGANLSHAPAVEKFSVYIENMSTVTLDKCLIVGNSGGGVKFVQTYLKPAQVQHMGFITIAGCDIDSNHGVGISGEYCRNCVIKGNWISSGRDDKLPGIVLANCQSSSITDNQVFYCGSSGIRINRCKYMTVSNNLCQANGLLKSEQPAGIQIIGSSYSSFTGNICNNEKYGWKDPDQLHGITAEGNSDNNIFTSNISTINIPSSAASAKNSSPANNVLSNNILR